MATSSVDVAGATPEMEPSSSSSSRLAQSCGGPRRTRFFEYCSLIPQDNEAPSKPAVAQGKPRLCARTYSLPVPSSSAVSDFAYKMVNGRDRACREDDPAFLPASTSKLNLKLPSITRKRRNTVSSPVAVRGCLKNGNKASSRPAMPPRTRSGSSFDPIYCPALARITSSPSSLPNGQLATSVSAPMSPVDPVHLPQDILPLSPCCEKCHDGVVYGQSPESNYMEKWSQAALRKREKDEEAKYERGEIKRKDFKPKLQDQVDELPPLREVPECVDELELVRKRAHRQDSGDDALSQPSNTSDSLFDSPVGSLSSQSSMEAAHAKPPCVKPGRNKCISRDMDMDDLAAALAEADKIIADKKPVIQGTRPQLVSRESGSGWERMLSRSFGSGI